MVNYFINIMSLNGKVPFKNLWCLNGKLSQTSLPLRQAFFGNCPDVKAE